MTYTIEEGELQYVIPHDQIYVHIRNEYNGSTPGTTTLSEIEADGMVMHSCFVDDMPTPLIDKIFQTQQLSKAVGQMFFNFVGRILYVKENNKFPDDTEVLPYVVGKAGAGKSVLHNLIQHLIPEGDLYGSCMRCSPCLL